MNIYYKVKQESTIILLSILSISAIFFLTAGKSIAASTKAATEQPVQKDFEIVESNDFPKAKEKISIRSYWVVATAYSSEVAQTDDSPCVPSMSDFNLCKYYQQHKIEDTIAANFLPLGTKVKFPELYGEKVFTVRDRMNKRYNGTARIDFWKSETTEAENFGVKSVKMEIIKY